MDTGEHDVLAHMTFPASAPELLELLMLKCAIVTIDAMGCQRKTCQKIIDPEVDYGIALKGNQGNSREDVELFFDEPLERDIGGDFVKQSETVDADHGRIEPRRYTVCSDIEWLGVGHHWQGLKAAIMTEDTSEIKRKCETIRRFYISSFVNSPEKISRCIRSHWQGENSLHWVLDVTFPQDDCRIRKANFATINHAAMNLVRQVPEKKMNLQQKPRLAAWDDDYMEAVIQQ